MKFQGLRKQSVAVRIALVVVTLVVGCGFQPDLFNPDLTTQLGLTPLKLPVNFQVSVLISAKNNTGRLLQADLSFAVIKASDGKLTETIVPVYVQPNQTIGMWVACVSAQYVSVGSIDQQINDPSASKPVPSGLVFLTSNPLSPTSTQPGYIEVPAINNVLQQGNQFGCGDNIIFTYNPASTGYTASVSVKRLAN